MPSALSIFVFFVAAQLFFAPHLANADNGLTYQTSTLWPQGTGPNQVFGSPAGFLTASRDPNNGWTYWGTRDWIGVVADRNPSNTSAINRILINNDNQADPSFAHIALVTSGPLAGSGWFATINNQDLWRFDLENPSPTPVKYYDRTFDNRLFRGILYEPTAQLFWVITDNDVIWINPLANPEPAEQANPPNGRLQNIQNGAALTVILRQDVPSGTSNVIMAGNAIVFKTPVTNNAWTSVWRKSDIVGRQVGAGQYLCGAINSADEVVYLGSSLGIGIEVTLSNLALNRIFFAPGEQFLTVLYDTKGATFWSSDRGTILRVNTNDFVQFAREVIPSVSNLRAAVQDPSTGLITYGANFGTEFNTYTVLKTSCPFECARCLSVDRQYCGVCKTTGVCTVAENCPAPNVWQRDGICPQTRQVSPASANTNGGTLLTVQGTIFEQASLHYCVFVSDVETIIVPVNSSNPTASPPTVTCTVPPISQATATSQINFGVRWGTQTNPGSTDTTGTRDWGGLTPFQTYRCDQLNCDGCFSTAASARLYPECVWCVRARRCSSAQACDASAAGNINPNSCPTISSVAPAETPTSGGTTITLNLNSALPAELNYVCSFSGITTQTTATVVGQTATCNTPASLPFSSATQSVSLTINSVTPSSPIIPRTVPFTYYNCSALQKCSDCLAYPTCGWCSADQKCGPIAALTCSPVNTNRLTCPRPTSANPPSALISAPPASIQIQGTNLEAYAAGSCIWSDATTGQPVFTTGFTFVSTSTVTCTTPGSPTERELVVSIANNNVEQTERVPFLFYTCNVTDCARCVDPRRQSCVWCNAGAVGQRLKCTTTAASTCLASNLISTAASCPRLVSVTPAGDSTAGSTTVTLSGDFLFPAPATNVSCQWSATSGANATFAVVPAVSATGSTIECTTPSAPLTGATNLRVLQDGIAYTGSIPFNFYNCSSLTTCASCLTNQFPRCLWCGVSCTAAVSCPTGRQVNRNPTSPTLGCPVLSTISPNFTISDGGDVITVFGGPFISDDAGNYRCSIGGIDSAGRQSSASTVECTTPRRSVGVANVKVFVDGVDYAPSSEVPLDFFSCTSPRSSSCDTACFTANSPNCGWCVSQATCTGQAKCPDFWLNQCLIAEFAPGSNHASLRGGEIITVDIAIDGNNGAQFAGFVATDLTCSFGSNYQLAAVEIVRNAATNATSSIRCITPAVPSDLTVQFTILYQGGALFQAKPFTFIDCNRNEPRCETCLGRKPFCGWCLDGNDCTTRGTCYQNAPCPVGGACVASSGSWTNTICPRVNSLLPRLADVNGGEELTVIGENFVRGERLHVAFNGSDDLTVPATVLNSTYLTCRVPRGPAPVETSVTIRHRINSTSPYRTFTTNSAVFAWQITNAINLVALGVGLGVGVAVIAGAIIAAVIYVRRKYRDALIVRVKEPNYTDVAFGNDLEAKYKMPDDSYKKLNQVLERREFGLQLAIQSFCPATEQDLVAKAMVHISHPNKAIDLINTLVRVEVAQCIQENTIFRGNSLVSKMFKFYSRIVGIRYLFRSIARVIAELETLGRKELHKKTHGETNNKKKGEASLLNMTMELDDNKLAKEGDVDVDLDTNILQLQLTCQKLFSVIVKSGTASFPVEFRRIFVQIDQNMLSRFGSNDAAYKAIGGFFFLRFVCPAITAPHVYGLLESPPNELTQRQLVLISKVLQSLANMAVPGKKEKYMATLAAFIESNIPKMGKFYDEIRKPNNMQGELDNTEVPKDAKQNALATLWGFIFLNQEKVQSAIYSETVGLDKTTAREVSDSVEELIYDYKTGPKKLESKKKGGKSSGTSAPIPDV